MYCVLRNVNCLLFDFIVCSDEVVLVEVLEDDVEQVVGNRVKFESCELCNQSSRGRLISEDV